MKNKLISILIIFVLIFISTCNTFSYAIEKYYFCNNLSLIKRETLTADEEYWVNGRYNASTISEIKVPAMLENIEITRIYDNTKSTGVFQNDQNLQKVDLSESRIQYIGYNCFKYCRNLNEFKNGKYLKEIWYDAFWGCNLNSITLYDGLERIGENAFYDAFSNEKEMYIINIPDTVTNIGENAFKVSGKKYRVLLVGEKDSVAQKYCEDNTECIFVERGKEIPTAEEILEEEIRKEKSKIFKNPISYNTDDANIISDFGIPTIMQPIMEDFYDIIKVKDGFIVVGFSYLDQYRSDAEYYQETFLSKAKGNDDAIIVKYNYKLEMEWFKSFGGSSSDMFEKIYKTKDEGYLAFGKTQSIDKDLTNINLDNSSYHSMVVKYDKNFNVISTRIGEYAEIYEENKKEILEDNEGKISNGRIVLDTISNGITGVSTGVSGYEMNALITKYDRYGYKEWTKTFDRNSKQTDDKFNKVVEVDDGYVFIGRSSSYRMNSYNKKIFVENAIIVKYTKPHDQIEVLNMQPYIINIGEQKSMQIYVPWEDVTIGEMQWNSYNEEIATVDYKGNITGKTKGRTTIYLNVRGKSKELYVDIVDPEEETIKNYKVTLDKTECILEKGATEILKATITPTTYNKGILWESSNTDVATINYRGELKAVGVGTTTITVTIAYGKSATCIVTVISPVESIQLNKTTISLGIGEKETLKATVYPIDATNKEIEWISDNTDVAVVSDDGIITTISEGVATITAKAKDGSGAKTTCTVKSSIIKVSSIILNKQIVELKEGETEALTITINPLNATSKEVQWTSNNTNIAVVSDEGIVTAVSEGKAMITATTSNGKVATCEIRVIKPVIKVESITLDMTEINLKKGEHRLLVATVNPTNATDMGVVWSSNNRKVDIDDLTYARAMITALSEGTAIITATARDGSGITATCTVTITDSEPENPKPDVPEKPVTPTIGQLGDTDGNGKITTKDAKMILQHIVKKITLTDEQVKRADTSKDTKITTKDAKMILQHIVKKIVLKN